jgi:spermidine/putrescine transport system ATP-binding protein
MAGGRVQLVELVKRFGGVEAVAGVDLAIAPGEFFSILGPSGCGKTTTLRMIAGFERPDGGSILLDGTDVVGRAPHLRNVNTVFQSYALFPHLTVAENVAFGLRYQGVAGEALRRKVSDALALVRLEGMEGRRPDQLSGGQQQRVALARALVLGPSVLLLDEPLGALDARLRATLQVELKSLQRELGVTFIYVTHDQQEALTMSDRVAVMRAGRVEQVGTPDEVYERPATAYVADFLGVSNLMSAQLDGPDAAGRLRARVGDVELLATSGAGLDRGPARLAIRPERVVIEPAGATGENRVPAIVERTVYVGASLQVVLRLAPGASIQAWVPNLGGGIPHEPGTPLVAHLPSDALRVLDADAVGRGGEPAGG